MKHKGPILTLAAGLVLAAVLMVLNLRATPPRPAAADAGEATTPATATATPPPATPPAKGDQAVDSPPPPTQAANENITYAGKVNGGAATLAIAVKNGKAVAYLCDGKKTEAWLQGDARNGELTLRGSNNARLDGSYTNGLAEGQVTAAGRRFTFSVKEVKPPSGLYRATANVRGKAVVVGWVVDEKKEQTGVLDIDGTKQPAGRLNLADNTTVVNDTTITAGAVDPSRGLEG